MCPLDPACARWAKHFEKKSQKKNIEKKYRKKISKKYRKKSRKKISKKKYRKKKSKKFVENKISKIIKVEKSSETYEHEMWYNFLMF